MDRTLIGIALSALLLGGCATEPATETARRDDAYVPIGSNIPRKDRKPEPSSTPVLTPGPYVSGPSAPRN